MTKVVGIDLGTTNSGIAYMEGGKPILIPNAEGKRLTSSVTGEYCIKLVVRGSGDWLCII